MTKYEYLKRTLLFGKWEKTQLAGILNFTQSFEINQGNYLYRKGSFDNCIYSIISGEFEIIFEYDSSHNDEKPEGMMRRRSNPKQLILLRVFKGNTLGDEDGLQMIPKRFSVKVVSPNAKVYSIRKNVASY